MRTLHRFALGLALASVIASAQAQQDIDKVNGSINAEAGQAYGSLETVNGSIRIGDKATVRSAETVNGSINVGDDARTGSLETVNGGIRAGERVGVDGGVGTVNGSIFIDRGGNVREGIETVNGGIGLVDTDVGGGIETVNGDLTVGVGSHVRGGIRYEKPTGWGWKKQRKPRVVIAQNARVDGPLVFEHEVDLYVHTSATIGPVTGATAVRYEGTTPPGGDR